MSAVDAVAGNLATAQLVIEIPEDEPDPIVPLRFNPTEYRVDKINNLAEIPIPGLEAPPIQFVRGGAAKLSVDVLLDTSDTLEDVRARFTDKLQGLLSVRASVHAPPIVQFVWDQSVFRGVLASAKTTFTMFTKEGVPIRASMALEILEYRPVEVQVREMRTESPDWEKAYRVRRGDSLSSIAAWAYKDPTLWRVIADANGLRDPRRLKAGALLRIPRIR